MEKPARRPAQGFDRAMIYLQGLPVAICPVLGLEGDRLTLMAGPLRFERDGRLAAELLPPEPPPASKRKVSGRIEGEERPGVLRVRLDTRPAPGSPPQGERWGGAPPAERRSGTP